MNEILGYMYWDWAKKIPTNSNRNLSVEERKPLVKGERLLSMNLTDALAAQRTLERSEKWTDLCSVSS